MTRALVICAICFQFACGGESPTAPTPAAPAKGSASLTEAAAALSVLVVGHVRNAPIAGVLVRIDPITAVGTSDLIEQTTGPDGLVRWHVVPNQRYTIRARNQVAITDALLGGDAQWLVSLPE
jgi:hypothetical protein